MALSSVLATNTDDVLLLAQVRMRVCTKHMDKSEFIRICSEGEVASLSTFNTLWTREGLVEAARRGHTDMVFELLAKDPLREKDDIADALAAACEAGHTELVWRLVGITPIGDVEGGIRHAAKGGHSALTFALVNALPNPMRYSNYLMALSGACAGGHLDLAQHIASERVLESHAVPYYNFLLCALSHGHLDVVQWLYGKVDTTTMGAAELMLAGCASGLCDVAQYVSQKHGVAINVPLLFESACHKGRVAAQRVLDHHTVMDFTPGLVGACSAGSVDVVNWLLGLGVTSKEGFVVACTNGHLAIAQLLYVESHRDQAFVQACTHGHAEVALWLIREGANPEHGFPAAWIGHHHKLYRYLLRYRDVPHTPSLSTQGRHFPSK